MKLKKRAGFRAKTNFHVGAAMSGPASSSFGYSGTPPVANQESEVPDEEDYRRHLSIGGVILVAVGAKKILLPAVLLSHPALFAITASASAITGYRYIRLFWNAMTGDEDLDVEALTGGTTIAMLLLGDGVTALTSVWLVNLSQYLKARTDKLNQETISSEQEQIPSKAATTPSDEARLPKFLIFGAFAFSGIAFVRNFWVVRQQLLLLLANSDQLVHFLRTSAMGAPLFTLVYTVAPLVLLPTTFLAISAGWLYGPVRGLIYSFVGGTTSAILAYLIGRRFGEKLFSKDKERSEGSLFSQGTIQRFSQKMVDHPFESVLMMELLYLPNDFVSYLSGFLQLDWKPFLLGNTLGNIPSTFSFVWFGASIVGNPLMGTPTLNLPTLAASGLIFVGSLTVSRYLSWEDEEIDEEPDAPAGGDIEMTPLGAV
jgi:uncharacterized membrane protein YdjX (TVP38/TMEM64 family)